MDIDILFDKLFEYFKVNSVSDLANKLGVSQPTVSGWKARNSISAIKKKCRELDIYQDIFGDVNISFKQKGNDNTQVGNQVNNGSSEFDDIDKDILQIVKALNETAKALKKKDELKTELTNLISKIATV